MKLEIEQLTNVNTDYFRTICDWQIAWWKKEDNKEKVIEFMSRCLNKNRIPQTYIALYNKEVVGMYQITNDDNVQIRPDYYPWLANVYVDEKFRGKGICTTLMNHANEAFKTLNINKIYLRTKHKNLYEKYGWKFLEEVEDFNGKLRKIYYLNV